jgi:hypothetical protein
MNVTIQKRKRHMEIQAFAFSDRHVHPAARSARRNRSDCE